MPDFVVIGTDTDVGKTTFALLWLSAFADRYDYWKPLETGPSDSEAIQSLCASIVVQRPVLHFDEAVAPLLAARYVESVIAGGGGPRGRAADAQGAPYSSKRSEAAFSPLNETEDQLALLRLVVAHGLDFNFDPRAMAERARRLRVSTPRGWRRRRWFCSAPRTRSRKRCCKKSIQVLRLFLFSRRPPSRRTRLLRPPNCKRRG